MKALKGGREGVAVRASGTPAHDRLGRFVACPGGLGTGPPGFVPRRAQMARKTGPINHFLEVLNMRFNRSSTLMAACIAAALATGCASRPDIRLDRNPSLAMSHYQTFSFYEPMATDESLYTTIISGRLKNAARKEL